jgi:transmembrane 9 superfamily member 2/4
VLDSMWRSYIFGMFGMILLNIFLLTIVIALISVILTYLTIRHEDWKSWHWRAFLAGAWAGPNMLVYCFAAGYF